MPVQPTSYRRLLPKFSFPLRETFAQGQINAFGLDGFSEARVGLSSWLFGAKSWRLRSDHLGPLRVTVRRVWKCVRKKMDSREVTNLVPNKT